MVNEFDNPTMDFSILKSPNWLTSGYAPRFAWYAGEEGGLRSVPPFQFYFKEEKFIKFLLGRVNFLGANNYRRCYKP